MVEINDIILKLYDELLALQSLKDWLLNHIHSSDKPMANCLREHGVH